MTEDAPAERHPFECPRAAGLTHTKPARAAAAMCVCVCVCVCVWFRRLQIIGGGAAAGVPREVRQAAAIALKNLIKKGWDEV